MFKLNKVNFLMAASGFLMLVACGSKTEKYRENERQYCLESKIQNQFIAHWNNSEVTIVISNDIKNYIDQNKDKIKFIEPNYSIKLPARAGMERTDRTLSANKILNEIGVLRAWRNGFQGKNILVAIIDSGVDISNQKISRNIFLNFQDSSVNSVDDDRNGFTDDVNGWNFTFNNGRVIDEIGHGTSIAGIITGKSMSGESLAIAPKAKILPVDIMSGMTGNEYDAKRAVDYAIQMKAQIINNSWSITCSYYLASSFKKYENQNVIFVNSVGNSPINVNENKVMLASLDLKNFLNVGSTDLYGEASNFSGFGRTVNIWAPGEQVPVLTSNNGSGVTKASGTSVSAAIVSGAAALVWSAHPRESAEQITNRLKRGSRNIGGRNFIDLDRAIY